MKVAYIVSGLPMSLTFVVNEMESHEKAGWDILPIVSCKRYSFERFSRLTTKWNQKALFRPAPAIQLLYLLLGVISHPLRYLRVAGWLMALLFHSPSEFAKALLEFSVLGYYAAHCRRQGAEHLHVHFASRSLSLGLMLGIVLGLPVSCTVHAFDIYMRSRGSLRYRLRQCRFISAISQYNIEYLRGKCGDPVADLCEIVHCGIDVTKFQKSPNPRNPGRIVSVARLFKKKGFDCAVEACSRLDRSGILFSFEIVGDGPEKERLAALIDQYGLNGKVKLLGAKSNDEVASLLNSAGIFLMPCIRDENGDMDGIPVAMMEAMACGIPVVSSRISGIPDLVRDGENGFLVEPGNAVAVAEKLTQLIHKTDLIERFGVMARRHVMDQFDMEKNAEKLRELINSK